MDPHDRWQAEGSNIHGSSESPLAYDNWCGDGDVGLSERVLPLTFASTQTTGKITYDHQSHMAVNENEVCTHSSSSGSGAPTVSRRRKKPKGFPKRPLSGYNIFFKEERVKVLEECNDRRAAISIDDVHDATTKIDRSSVSFQELGKIVGKRWKTLSDEDRRRFESLADQDNLRYRSEMDDYNDAKRKRNEEKSLRTIEDDVDDTTQPSISNSSWSTMVLTRPSEIYPSFYPYSRSNQPTRDNNQSIAQYWQRTENASNDNSSVQAAEPVFSYPIPPGTELTLPDHQGIERNYQVQYNFFKMTRRDAEIYMAQLAQTPTVTPYGFTDYPPPPPGATYVQQPHWTG